MDPPSEEILLSNSEQDSKDPGVSDIDAPSMQQGFPNEPAQEKNDCLVSLEMSPTSRHQQSSSDPAQTKNDSMVSVDSASFNLAIEEDVLDFEDFDDPCKKNSEIVEKCDNIEQSSDNKDDTKFLKDGHESQNVDKQDKEEVSDSKESEGLTNLWVSGISLQTKAKDLFLVFTKFGDVKGAKILANSKAEGAKCFAFVTMGSSSEAERCIKEQDNIWILGKSVTIKFAQSNLNFSKTGKMTALKKQEVNSDNHKCQISGETKRKEDSNLEQKTSSESQKSHAKTRRSGSPRNKSPLRGERLGPEPSHSLTRTRESSGTDKSMLKESRNVSIPDGEESRHNGRVKSHQERPFIRRGSQHSPGPRSPQRQSCPIRGSPTRYQSSLHNRSPIRERSPFRPSPVRLRHPVTKSTSRHRSPQQRSLPRPRSPPIRSPPKHRVPQGRSPLPHRTSQRRAPPTHGDTLRRSPPRQRSPRRSPPKQRSPQRLPLPHGSPPKWQASRQRMSPPRQRSPQRRSPPPKQRSHRQELPVPLRQSPPRNSNPSRGSPYQPRSPQQRSSSKYQDPHRHSPQRQRSPLRNNKETFHDNSPWRRGSSPQRTTQKPVRPLPMPNTLTQRSPRIYNNHEHKSLLNQGSTSNCKYPDPEPSLRISNPSKSFTQTKTSPPNYGKNLPRSPLRHSNSKRESPIKQKDLSRLDSRGSPKRKISHSQNISSGYERLLTGSQSNGADGPEAERREGEKYESHKRPRRIVETERSKIRTESREGMEKLGHSNVRFGDPMESLTRREDPVIRKIRDLERRDSKLARDPWAVSKLPDSEKPRSETTNNGIGYHPKMMQSNQVVEPQEPGNTQRIKIQNPFGDVELSSNKIPTPPSNIIIPLNPFYNPEPYS